MTRYVVLFRGINVGGKNRVPMAELKDCLEGLGFNRVSTYIASGNVILESKKDADQVKTAIEAALPGCFELDSELVKVLVLTLDQLQDVVEGRPEGFGERPDKYHSDAVFLLDLEPSKAVQVFSPREGVDRIWQGNGVIYSQRLSSQRTKSRLNRIVSTPEYGSMTIRTWNTVKKLLEMVQGE